MIRVSAYSSRELLAVLRGLRNLDRETKKHTRAGLRVMVREAWQAELAKRSRNRLQRRVLVDTARATVSDQNVRLQSARLSRSLSGGLKPSAGYGPVEFGATAPRNAKAFGAPNRRGNVVYPTAAEIIPRVLAMYTQTFIRAIHEALEGKSS